MGSSSDRPRPSSMISSGRPIFSWGKNPSLIAPGCSVCGRTQGRIRKRPLTSFWTHRRGTSCAAEVWRRLRKQRTMGLTAERVTASPQRKVLVRLVLVTARGWILAPLEPPTFTMAISRSCHPASMLQQSTWQRLVLGVISARPRKVRIPSSLSCPVVSHPLRFKLYPRCQSFGSLATHWQRRQKCLTQQRGSLRSFQALQRRNSTWKAGDDVQLTAHLFRVHRSTV
mmetsp:Transcript_6401/g.17835  ORF Transcript_6401/g.17835 Transcript_6401/m.17835 type:complete len:227 (+) Transcript_6401:342-1022(+)